MIEYTARAINILHGFLSCRWLIICSHTMQLVANATDHTEQGLRCMTMRGYTVRQINKKTPLSPAGVRGYVYDKVILKVVILRQKGGGHIQATKPCSIAQSGMPTG